MSRSRRLAFALAAAVAFAGVAAEPFTARSEGPKPRRATVTVDFAKDCGPIKPLNGVNNGPTTRDVNAMPGNFAAFKAARIPFGRVHDASEDAAYGSDHVGDISAMFPDFDADENDPASYDFAMTDEYLRNMIAAGTEPLFRLGQRIELAAKRYNVYPPKDFAKWARICEHVIRHYNEGWADGFRWNIRYWEIWNEPDNDWEPWRKGLPPIEWGGTAEQFFEFYETAAKHLKKCFPHLRIGGPSLSHSLKYADIFLKYQREHGTPIDFFAWHIYTHDPYAIAERASGMRKMMEKHGYGGCETLLGEWNYKRPHDANYHYSVARLCAQKGGAFVAAGLIVCQTAPIDIATYYDAKPDNHFNGAFDKTTLAPTKPYYALYSWGRLAALGTSVAASSDVPDIFAAAARDGNGRRAILLARFADDDDFSSDRPVTVRLAQGRFPAMLTAHVTDDVRQHTETRLWSAPGGELQLKMPPQSFMLIECSGVEGQ